MDSITSADGTRIAIRRVGRGQPIVMLHGSGGGLHSWASVAKLLSDEYQTWLVARRGYQPSDVPATVKSFAHEVADVHAVLAAIGAEDGRRAHLVGASYGATLALHVARGHPSGHRLAPLSLSIYEPPLFAAGADLRPVLQRYRALLRAGNTAAAGLLFAGKVAQVPPVLLAGLSRSGAERPQPADAYRSAVGSLHDLEALAGDSGDLERWAGVELPVLLMQGARTWEPIPATMDALAAVLPHVERVCWDGQSHFATTAAPTLVAATLRGFLRGLTRP